MDEGTKEKFYTTQEVAELLDCTCQVVRNTVSYHQIDKKVVSTPEGRILVFTEDAVRLIKEYNDAKRDKAKQKQIKRKEEEELQGAEDHPLVTDKRFLSLRYWPDTVPACFQECEEND